MIQSGLYEHWHNGKYVDISMAERCKNFQPKKVLLTLKDLQSAFLILAIGLALAVGVFLLEKIRFKVLSSRPSGTP